MGDLLVETSVDEFDGGVADDLGEERTERARDEGRKRRSARRKEEREGEKKGEDERTNIHGRSKLSVRETLAHSEIFGRSREVRENDLGRRE